jgi:hypothetical protein
MHVEPSVEILESPRVEHTRPGLGRVLARVSTVFLFGTPLLLVVLFSQHVLGNSLLNYVLLVGGAGAFFFAFASALCSSTPWPRPRGAVLRASENGLTIERERKMPLTIAKGLIEGGMVISGWPHVRLMIQLRDGDVIIADVRDEPLAQRALAVLGVSADLRRVCVRLGTANRQILAVVVSLPISAIVAGGLAVARVLHWQRELQELDIDVFFTAVGLLFAVILTHITASTFRPKEVIVGSDGIRVQGVHRHEFSHSQIDRAEAQDDKLVLFLRGSTRLISHVAASGEPGVVAGLAERINQAVERARKGPEERPVAGLLDPAGRPLVVWREALRTLVPDAGYRTSGVTRESLIEVLEDPAAPPGRRIGAALALRGAEHPESRARIRIVADACVDDALRQALEEAAEDELAENTLRRVLR